MKKSRTWIAGTMALAIALGGGVWVNQYANAAEASGQQQTGAGAPFDGRSHGPRGGGFMIQSDTIAGLLGMTADELKEAMKSGKTLADIAAEKSVDVQTIIDAVVANMTEILDKQLADGKLTQEQYDQRKAELTDRATKMVNGTLTAPDKGDGQSGMGGHSGMGGMDGQGQPGPQGGFMAQSDTIADLLGITADELKEALKSGKTLADIAAEKSVDVQTIIDAEVATMTEILDKQLADGKLTQEQYDQRKAELTDRVTKMVNGEFPARPESGDKGAPDGNRHHDFQEEIPDDAQQSVDQ